MYRVADGDKIGSLLLIFSHMIIYVVESIRDYIGQEIHMNPLFLVLLVGFSIQLLKVVIDVFRYKAFYFGHFFSSGGFPSFHTGLSSSITMFVLLEYGFDSTLFAVVVCFSLLFAYDAMNIRFQAGQHAQYINKLRFELQGILFKEGGKKTPLKERIGHTPLEVLGGFVIGSVLTYILYYMLYL